MINVVVIQGNLTRDPELRNTPSGASVCDLRIANNVRAKIKGEWTDKANFVDVTVWGTTAENAAKYLTRGSGVIVRGRLDYQEWEHEGNKRSVIRIQGDEVQYLARTRGKEEADADEPSADAGDAAEGGEKKEAPF